MAPLKEDSRSLSDLYKAALSEGGKLLVYAGGDTPSQLDSIKSAFVDRFPGINLEIVIDFSKYHNARIDNQIKLGTLLPDLAHLQTLQDFDRWKQRGVLLPYKPIGWDSVYPQFKDPSGYYTSIYVDAFSTSVNKEVLGPNEEGWPTEAEDFLNPMLKGKIVSTYPNDDDAVLYWYKMVVEKYGWSWLDQFIKNEPLFVRGTQEPWDLVWNSSAKIGATFSTDGFLKENTDPVQFILPKKDPFVSWGQRAAIFKGTQNLAAAQLYLSWWLDMQTQRDTWYMWSVRKDVPVPVGFKSIWEYQGQTDPVAFQEWMRDRGEVERFKSQVTLYVGEVKGDLPTGNLGLFPDKMIN